MNPETENLQPKTWRVLNSEIVTTLGAIGFPMGPENTIQKGTLDAFQQASDKLAAQIVKRAQQAEGVANAADNIEEFVQSDIWRFRMVGDVFFAIQELVEPSLIREEKVDLHNLVLFWTAMSEATRRVTKKRVCSKVEDQVAFACFERVLDGIGIEIFVFL